MIVLSTTTAAGFFAALSLMGAALHLTAVARLRRHLSVKNPSVNTDEPLPPITHWRAVKRGVPQLAEKIEALARAARDGDQLLIGVDAGSPDAAVCAEAAARVPGRTVRIVECEPGRAANPKISKFLQMAPHAVHARWLLTDSEAELDSAFVESFRREWHAEKWDVLTAGYRFTGLRTAPQILDAAPALFSLWPGIMHVRQVDFTLGACTGVLAAQVQEIGDWSVLGEDLAEDRRLGLELFRRGRRVGFSRNILALAADVLSWGSWLRHQHRVAVTYRRATPAGALGLPIMHALPLALLAGLLGGGWWWSVVVLIYTLRLVATAKMRALTQFRVPALPLLLAFVPLLETFFWALAWLPFPVWWAGKWRSLR